MKSECWIGLECSLQAVFTKMWKQAFTSSQQHVSKSIAPWWTHFKCRMTGLWAFKCLQFHVPFMLQKSSRRKKRTGLIKTAKLVHFYQVNVIIWLNAQKSKFCTTLQTHNASFISRLWMQPIQTVDFQQDMVWGSLILKKDVFQYRYGRNSTQVIISHHLLQPHC